MTSVFRLVLLGMGLMLSLSSVTEADEVVGRVVDFKNAGYFGVLGKQDGRTVFLYARLKEVACPSTEQERERDTMMQGDDDQRQGRAANDFTRGLVGEQTVTVHFDRLEPDGISCFARVTLEDGRDVGRELLKAGLGWLRDPRNADAELVALQSEARRSGEGIWSERWYKDLGPLWWKILCGIGVLFLLHSVNVAQPHCLKLVESQLDDLHLRQRNTCRLVEVIPVYSATVSHLLISWHGTSSIGLTYSEDKKSA